MPHRSAESIGGLYFTHAIKNDGQEPTKMVEPAEQWRAFDAMMATITPDALALPEGLIQKDTTAPYWLSIGCGDLYWRPHRPYP